MDVELDLVRPLRGAVRALARTRSYTLTAILTVGGAIGLAASVYAVVSATFFAALPWQDAEELVQFWQTASPASIEPQDYIQPLRMEEWVRGREFRTMSEVAATGMGPTLVMRREQGGERVTAAPLLGDWFGLLGVQAARGRVLAASDLLPGAASTAVVSHAFWRRDLGAGELGTILLSGVPFTVVGVMPPRFESDRRVWMSVEALPEELRPRAYRGVGRIRPGSTVREAATEVQLLAANQIAVDSARFAGLGATARSITEARRSQDRPRLWMLAGVVTAVLLVALNNLAVLTLVRAESRSTDLAVRASLGADRWELARGLALEGLLVGVAGAGIGLAVAHRGVEVAAGLIGDPAAPPVLGLDTIGVALGLGALVAASLALIPLQKIRPMDLRSWLQRGTGGAGSTPSERRTRKSLVGMQVALAVVLISVTSVVGSAYAALSELDVGYDPTRIVEARPDWELADVPVRDQWSIAERALVRIERAPEVNASAAWQQFGRAYPPRPEIEAVTDGPQVELGTFDGLYRYYEITPGFFGTLGVGLVGGREFTVGDGTGAPVAIISSRGAKLWWPGEDPLGRQIKLGEEGVWMTVIGIAPDFRQLNMLGKAPGNGSRPFMPLLFMPAGQFKQPPVGWGTSRFWGGVRIGARADGRVAVAARTVREAIGAEAPDLPYLSLGALHDAQMQMGESLVTTGRMVGLGLIAVLALALIGIVGVVSESISRRTREVGVRVALGAGRVSVTWSVARESIVTAAWGVLAGVAVLFLVDGWLRSTVFDYMVTRLGPELLGFRVLGLGASAILAVAVVAILLASRRALRIDPVEVLRAE